MKKQAKHYTNRPMTREAIQLIAQAMCTQICDKIVTHCALETDEEKLRDAVIEQLAENSYWSLPQKEYRKRDLVRELSKLINGEAH
jgi:hypothetical protein